LDFLSADLSPIVFLSTIALAAVEAKGEAERQALAKVEAIPALVFVSLNFER
jgi:hypothetical protein